MLTPEQIKETQRQYNRAIEQVEEILANAMCETYHKVTGKKASDRLYEKLLEVIRYET